MWEGRVGSILGSHSWARMESKKQSPWVSTFLPSLKGRPMISLQMMCPSYDIISWFHLKPFNEFHEEFHEEFWMFEFLMISWENEKSSWSVGMTNVFMCKLCKTTDDYLCMYESFLLFSLYLFVVDSQGQYIDAFCSW